jgi:predicted nucleotidyltransferase
MEYQNILAALEKNTEICIAYVFGSVARGKQVR